ncbi:SDR family oxidoreductase [Actinomadura oligospora]|uniref:SDR family oxidoreductase n=1 Tax=Actinomadura oligospora TaxID=111804 RepID=UPI0004B53775|nr:SDR family oxidoreductase [Actinomadura oligospora]
MSAQPELRPAPSAPSVPFEGRVAVVTGASSGIGAATARRLAESGAAVVLLARRSGSIEDTARELRAGGTTALAVQADVTSVESLEQAARDIVEQVGTPDLLVNNAGTMYPGPLEERRLAEWRSMLDTNVLGLLQTTGVFIGHLLEAASAGRQVDLVNISSIAGTRMFPPEYAVYSASKAAVNAVSESLRNELGPQGIRVSDLQPGLVATEIGDHTPRADSKEAIAQLFVDHKPLTPDEVAEVIAFVVSRPAHINLPHLVVTPVSQ